MRITINKLKDYIHYRIYVLRQYPRLRAVKHNVSACGKNLRVYGKPVLVSPENIRIGDNCILNNQCVPNASESPIIIGNNVTVSSNAMILAGTYDPKTFLFEQKRHHVYKEVKIGDNVWVCAGAIICPGVHILGGAIIAAGAVVTKDINEKNVVVAGNPASIVKRY